MSDPEDGTFGDVLPLSGGAKVDNETLSLLFLHSRRILFTLMSEELDEGCFTALVSSSEVTESNENLLDGLCEGGRPSSIDCNVGAPRLPDARDELLPGGTPSVAAWWDKCSFGKCCDCRSSRCGTSGVEGYRPKGSGESGITGESAFRVVVKEGVLRGGYKPWSSARALCLARVSSDIVPDLLLPF